MEWIVKIEASGEEEDQKVQRIRIVFEPLAEKIHIYGEAKVKNNKWTVFSWFTNKMEISLDELKQKMEDCVVQMRTRLKEYENLDKGFSVLKWVGFEEDVIDE